MILDWNANLYLAGPGFASVNPLPPAPGEAGFGLLYKVGQSFVWVQYGDTFSVAGDSATYALVYKVGQSFVWVQFGDTPAAVSSWQADGIGNCAFNADAGTSDVWLRMDGDAVTTWFLDVESVTGWGADGSSTCEFFGLNGTPVDGGFIAQGKSTCTFNASQTKPIVGFQADGKATAIFMGSLGSSEECLTAALPPLSFPNFVY